MGRAAEEQGHVGEELVLVGSGAHLEALGDEAREARQAHGCAAHEGKQRGERHLPCEAAELAGAGGSRLGEHGADHHEEEALVEDVRHRVGGHAVQRQLGAHAHAHHHEAELVHEAVGKHAAEVVLEHGEHEREERHDPAEDDEELLAGKAARQRVDRHLRGEGREPHGAGGGGGGVGVLHPAVEEREGRLHTERQEQQRGVGRAEGAEVVEGQPMLGVQAHEEAGQQEHAREHHHQQVAEAPRGSWPGCPSPTRGTRS